MTNKMRATDSVLLEVSDERVRQNDKWGEQNHDLFKWCVILGEEVGEVNKAVCDGYQWAMGSFSKDKLAAYRAELIQVAAVAVSMVECLDRGKW